MHNSPRLVSKLTGEHDTGFEGGPETIADQIMGAIERARLHHDLSVLPEPAEFLDIICERRSSRSAELDRPCCHILLGENDIALRLLTERVARNEDYWPSKTTDAEMALALALVGTLERGEDAAAELRRRCHTNALALGFQPAPLPDNATSGSME